MPLHQNWFLCPRTFVNIITKTFKHWVKVSIKNMSFSFLGQIFQYYLLGLKACQLRFASFLLQEMVA